MRYISVTIIIIIVMVQIKSGHIQTSYMYRFVASSGSKNTHGCSRLQCNVQTGKGLAYLHNTDAICSKKKEKEKENIDLFDASTRNPLWQLLITC